jgi:hypothetical protein
MPASKWLERAHAALREQGIPKRQQLRFMEELQDHLTDLQEANMNDAESHDVEQTMGSPEPLAQALAESYRRERFLVRHPLLACAAFTLGPLAFHFLLTLVLCALVMTGLFFILKTPPGELDEALETTFSWAFGAFSALAGAVVTLWFCRAARRNRLSWRMSLLGCVALALGTPLLAADMFRSRAGFAAAVLATAAASLATWYWAAWRGERWREEPISLSRHYPVLVSGLGSVVAAMICLAGYLLLTMLLMILLVDVIGRPRSSAEFALLAQSCKYIPFAIAALVCWRMTVHCPRQRLYSLGACVGVALFATTFTAGVTHTPGEPSSMQFGIGIGNAFHWSLLAQFATPLAVWGALTLSSRQPLPLRMA